MLHEGIRYVTDVFDGLSRDHFLETPMSDQHIVFASCTEERCVEHDSLERKLKAT